MTMTLEPLDDALAALDTFEANADRRKRAWKMAEAMVDPERSWVIHRTGTIEIAKAMSPHVKVDRWAAFSSAKSEQAAKEAGRNFDALVARECETMLRQADEAAIYADPDRQEQTRIWNSYTNVIGRVAWSKGNRSDAFIAKWSELIQDRDAAEEMGESTVGIDRRLEKLTGYPYPVLPGAAWETADVLPDSERQAEMDRLEAKYGPRKPPGEARHRTRKSQ
jgi:hypothetical protein